MVNGQRLHVKDPLLGLKTEFEERLIGGLGGVDLGCWDKRNERGGEKGAGSMRSGKIQSLRKKADMVGSYI